MIDHRRFLGRTSREILPYLGGPSVAGRDRRLRVDGSVEPGWTEFEIEGREARAIGPAARPELAELPTERGHALGDYLVHSDARAEVLFLASDAEAALFTPLRARRWPSGALLFDGQDFETGAEEAARRAFEEHRTLAGVGGVPSPLRAAFGYAVAMRVGLERGTTVAPAEVRLEVGRIAEGGDGFAATVVERIEHQRAEQRRAQAEEPARRPTPRDRPRDEDRIDDALAAAGGQLLSTQVRGDLVEIRFLLRGERFSSLLRPDTLQVIDAGICLSGADRSITVDSLPSVIIEGFDTGRLYITRHD